MIKSDRWIKEQSEKNNLIYPFVPELVRKAENGNPVISYGTSSYGYDIRLSPEDFRIFRHIPGQIVDPKNFNPDFLEPAELFIDNNGVFFIVPGNSYALGVAVERLEIPDNVTVICLGKSTYARCGLIANLTPAEASWKGNLTLEFSNSSNSDCRIYVNEGVVQLLFLESDETCEISYETRKGKYQNQTESITLPRV